MKHASLFSGIGGFDLAAHWMGWNNIFYCENDPFCRQVLKYHFQSSIAYEDITTTNFRVHAGQIDILTGGFPCQPFSDAGLKGGTDDPRYLWPQMFRAIREIRPRWVIAENVRGLISWNGGMVFDTVCSDLENEGYEVLPFLLPACGVNAPHRRYRIWFVAYCADAGFESLQRERKNRVYESEFITNTDSHDAGRCRYGKTEYETSESQSQQKEWKRFRSLAKRTGNQRTASNTSSDRLQERNKIRTSAISWENIGFDGFPTQSPILSGDDGLSFQLDGITLSEWRRESVKGFGNAIVPQEVLQLYKAIERFEI